jgi:CHAD domain-containing protein
MKLTVTPWKPQEPASLNARRILPELVREYFRKGRKLDRDSGSKAMHRFRLRTKRLRYTLEAFVAVYGSGLKPRIAGLRPIQNALGDLHDCEVLLSEVGDKLPHKARSYVEKRAEEKRKEFLQYWRQKFDAKGEDKKWERYLGRSPRATPGRSKTTKP